MTINDEALTIIKVAEGLRLKAYRNKGDVWTIGFGHTQGVTPLMQCSIVQAETWLNQDVADAENLVIAHIKVPLNENQYGALVSLIFNVGVAPLLKTLGAKLNEEDYAGAAAEFPKWNHDNGVVLPGLSQRRLAEQKLFLTPIGA